MSSIAVNTITDASGGNTASINGATPTNDNLMGRNRIQNGDMRIDQRNAGAAVTTNGDYPVDRWFFNNVSAASASGEQVQDAPAGFVDSLKYTVTTADASLDADDRSGIFQRIEGFNAADFGWGTANAQPVTVSFWVKSSISGTYGGSISNGNSDRSYAFTYTISSTGTWEYKTVTIPGDTSGTWPTDNTRWGSVYFSVGMGSTRSGTAGAWAGTNYFSATGATSIMSTLNATWYITGVQLEAGSVATSFERRPYGTELMLCQRYCEVIRPSGATTYAQIAIGQSYSATAAQVGYFYQTAKRAQPTVTYDTASKYVLLNATDGAVVCSSIQTGRSDVTSLAINAVVGSNTFTAGHANRLLANNTDIPVTIISAEL